MTTKPEKRLVYVFQLLPGRTEPRPYLAELVSESAGRAKVRVGHTEYQVNRGACSEQAFTESQLSALRAETTPKPKRGKTRTRTDEQPKPKVEGSWW